MAFASLKVQFRISGGLGGVARYLTTLLLIKFQKTNRAKLVENVKNIERCM